MIAFHQMPTFFVHLSYQLTSTPELLAMNYNAYGLESTRTPSYVSSSFGGVKASSTFIGGHEGPLRSAMASSNNAVSSTTSRVSKTETVVVKTVEKEQAQVAPSEEAAAEAISEPEQTQEKTHEQEQEQEQGEEEAVAEE